MKLLLPAMVHLFDKKGYTMKNRPYELNIVGVRSNSLKGGFIDEIHFFYKNGSGKWIYSVCKGTTDPGTFYLNDPAYPKTTAILAEGQYGGFQLGYKGALLTLSSRKPLRVVRNYNRTSILDLKNGIEEVKSTNINIIHANFEQSPSGTVIGYDDFNQKHNEGAQVLAYFDDYQKLMRAALKSEKLYGNDFTYTLIDLRAEQRRQARHLALGALIVATVVTLWFKAVSKLWPSNIIELSKPKIRKDWVFEYSQLDDLHFNVIKNLPQYQKQGPHPVVWPKAVLFAINPFYERYPEWIYHKNNLANG